MKIKKIIIPLFVLLFLGAIGFGLLQISKSRTFQFFGEIIGRVDTSEKVVALTFDDAPTIYTDNVIKILEKENINATFYIIGEQAEKYPDVVKNVVTQGHELGNHSYTHTYLLFRTPADIANEIEKTNSLIRSAGYQGEITMRPPFGKKLLILPWYLSQHKIKTIMADVEPDTYYQGNSAKMVKYTLETTKPGSIIVMHPFCEGVCQSDRDSLAQIIEGLKAEGFRFVTVSELLGTK